MIRSYDQFAKAQISMGEVCILHKGPTLMQYCFPRWVRLTLACKIRIYAKFWSRESLPYIVFIMFIDILTGGGILDLARRT